MDLCIYLIDLSCSLFDISDVAGAFLQKLYGSKFQDSIVCKQQNTHTKPVGVQACLQTITSTMYAINNIKLIVQAFN
jgi:hypothetical protein